MKLSVLKPDGATRLEVDAVFFPGDGGLFEVLPGHAPMISTLKAGELRWRIGTGEDSLEIGGGVVRIKDDLIDVCAQ